MKSEPYSMPDAPTEFPPVLHHTMRCPKCLSSWDGGSIPEKSWSLYSPPYRWSKLIGVEVLGKYDGVHHWECPCCRQEFPRWIEKDGKAIRPMFKD